MDRVFTPLPHRAESPDCRQKCCTPGWNLSELLHTVTQNAMDSGLRVVLMKSFFKKIWQGRLPIGKGRLGKKIAALQQFARSNPSTAMPRTIRKQPHLGPPPAALPKDLLLEAI